ncbi:MAG: thioredoxin TrxC [Alphaproteobacteria bacterium]
MPTDPLLVACPSCGTLNRVPAARLTGGGTCGRCRGRLFEGRPVALTAANFDRHAAESDLPLLVDFWAAWCAPCRAFAPTFARAAEVLEPRVRLGKVDSDAEPDLSRRFGIRSIPSLILVQRGRERARAAGALPLADLVRWTEQALSGPAA